MLFSLLLCTALDSAAVLPPPHRAVDEAMVSVAIDSTRHQVRVTVGPFHLPNMEPMNHQTMDHGASHNTPLYRFAWPTDGWLRGFTATVLDGDGRPLPKHIMHHLIGVNFSRRQLLYPAAERLFGAGVESGDFMVPSSIGVPMKRDMELGFYIAWHNDTGQDLDGVYVTMTMQYLPRNQNPRPLDILPLYMDVNLTVGGGNTYDVPPGRSEKAWEFIMPTSGRLVGYGGHLHDYGIGLRLEDVASGKVIARVKAVRDASGRVSGVTRGLPGVRGAGLKLKAGNRYRVVGVYDNPTGAVLVRGAMAHITGVFAPDNPAGWPGINETDPEYQRDLASLELMGSDAEDSHHHADHDHNN